MNYSIPEHSLNRNTIKKKTSNSASKNSKVLIVYPGKNQRGGVSELYNIVHFQSDEVNYFEIYGSFRNRINILDSILMYVRFVSKINKYEIIYLNPSLIKKSFFRDAGLILLSRIFNKKILVFWHGWEDKIFERIKRKFIYKALFNHSFNKANAHVVLGKVFQTKLRSLNYQNPIFIEKNCAHNQFLIKEKRSIASRSLHAPIRLLFLSRIEKSKGIYITVDTLRMLNEKSTNKYELLIAGDGSEIVKIKEYIELNKIQNVKMVGYVNGLQKHELLKTSDIFLFPSFEEGLPLVILESMIYGIPIITRPVGGIPDIVKDFENGFLTESKDPKIFAELVSKISSDVELYKKISKTNTTKALEFSPERFKQRLKVIYDSL